MIGHVEIAGAGFAGLTLGTALAHRGWSVRIHEAAAEVRSFGAGIFLWENGLQTLRSVGGYDTVLARSHQAQLWEERDADDTLLGTRPFPLPGSMRMLTLTRHDLHTALLRSARNAGVHIRPSSRIVAADPEGVLTAADGSIWRGDLVVGADGIRSAVRDSLGLLERHLLLPFGIYRLLVPLARAPGATGRWRNYVNYWNLEDQRRVLYVPCNENDLYLLLGALDSDTEALRSPVDAAVWATSFPSLAPIFTELPPHPRYDHYEAVTLTRWSAGKVAIIGDAAHAMPPTLGQGAGTAMVNALSLATALASSRDVTDALARWEASERPLTADTQQMSINLVEDLVPRRGEVRDGWDDRALAPARRAPATVAEDSSAGSGNGGSQVP